MNPISSALSDPYEENAALSAQITEILSSAASSRIKMKRLKELHSACGTPLAKSHVAYYIENFRAKRERILNRLIAAPFLIFFALHMAYRAYYDLHPDKPHYTFSVAYTDMQMFGVFILIPVFLMVYYMIRYLIIWLSNMLNGQQMWYLKTICILLFLLFALYMTPRSIKVTPPETTVQEEYMIELPAESETELPVETEVELLYETASEIQKMESLPSRIAASQVYIPTAKDLVGGWIDLKSQRCWLSIEQTWENCYSIYIYWSSSAWENSEWEFSGILDESTGIMTYSGDKIHSIYYDDGTNFKEFVYTDGDGIFYMDQEHHLYWEDYKEQVGERCIFEKDPVTE